MGDGARVRVLCNGADAPAGLAPAQDPKTLSLSYVDASDIPSVVRLGLPDFVRGVLHLPDRFLDLLELAAYVYCADRLVSRGDVEALEYHSWARSFEFIVRVRDYEFWRQEAVSECLAGALQFMTGDRDYHFSFQPGWKTPKTGLFDSEPFSLEPSENLSIVLFSGGLDSLAGALQRLDQSEDRLCLVSHQSGLPSTKRTQDQLSSSLRDLYQQRVAHYRFECHLRSLKHATEETQRTRAFLFVSIAFAIARACNQNRIFVCENGVTSMNFARREDLSNARTSRTTHPQTVARLTRFFAHVMDKPVRIELPFLWNTKTDVVEYVKNGPHPELLTSSVSCSRRFRKLGQATHCGECFQCVDRRIAAYAAAADDIDEAGIYAADIVRTPIACGEARTTVVDYLRQANNFATWNIDHFFQEMVSELSDVVDYLPDSLSQTSAVQSVWTLCHRHGEQVLVAMRRMRELHDNLHLNLEKDSILQLISDREYLKDPVARLVETITSIVSCAIPTMFGRTPPADERALNAAICALLETHRLNLVTEHPTASFAGADVMPDHSAPNRALWVESKYIRKGTPPSKATEGMAADLTKYPQGVHILFLVYDPQHEIGDEQRFRDDFESKGRCTVCVLR